jgi:hypothetical protein
MKSKTVNWNCLGKDFNYSQNFVPRIKISARSIPHCLGPFSIYSCGYFLMSRRRLSSGFAYIKYGFGRQHYWNYNFNIITVAMGLFDAVQASLSCFIILPQCLLCGSFT